jgi:probable addiction module antidote protein
MANLAQATSLNRETLYRTLSANGNPRLSSLGLILQALGLQLNFAASDDGPRAA